MKYTYNKVHTIVKEVFTSDKRVQWRASQSVVNDGFPGNFNLSFNEPELLSEYGQYMEYDHDTYFAKIQNVIRHNDLNIVKSGADTKHLTSFEMAGISFIDTDASKKEENVKIAIDMFADIFFNKLGLNPKKLYIKVCAGGKVSDLTAGRYDFEKNIPKDSLTYAQWLKHGVPKENFIWDATRDTFLSLFMFARPTPWGYRNELLYDVDKGLDEDALLDIGTIEYVHWKPVFENPNVQKLRHYMIKDIVPWGHHVVACGMGVERLLMAANGLESAMQCDHLAPVYNAVLHDADTQDNKAAFVFVDTLRSLYKIIADAHGYVTLTKSRREKTIDIARIFFGAMEILGIGLSKHIYKYIEALRIFSSDKLASNIDHEYVAREIQRIFEWRGVEEYPVWPRAEFYDTEDGFAKIADEIMEERGTEVLAIVPERLFKDIPEAAEDFRKRRIKNNIKLKAIVGTHGKDLKERYQHNTEELRQMRFSKSLVRNLKTATYIYRNKVAILSADEIGKGGMIIENKEYAEMMRRNFMFMWRRLSGELDT